MKPEDESRPTDPPEEASSDKAGAPKNLYQALAALDGNAATEPEPPPLEQAPDSEQPSEQPVPVEAAPEEPPPPLVKEPSRSFGFLKIVVAVAAVAVIAWAVVTWILPTREPSQAANPEPIASPTLDVPAVRITGIVWQQTATTTLVTITGDGLLGSDMVESTSLGGDRHLIKVLGITEQYQSLELAVETSQLARIRTWLHDDRQPTELHLVLDLAGTGVVVGQPELSGSRLTVELTTTP